MAHRFEHVVALRQVALYAREHFVEGARDLAHFVISALRQRRGGLGVRAEALDRFAKPFERQHRAHDEYDDEREAYKRLGHYENPLPPYQPPVRHRERLNELKPRAAAVLHKHLHHRENVSRKARLGGLRRIPVKHASANVARRNARPRQNFRHSLAREHGFVIICLRLPLGSFGGAEAERLRERAARPVERGEVLPALRRAHVRERLTDRGEIVVADGEELARVGLLNRVDGVVVDALERSEAQHRYRDELPAERVEPQKFYKVFHNLLRFLLSIEHPVTPPPPRAAPARRAYSRRRASCVSAAGSRSCRAASRGGGSPARRCSCRRCSGCAPQDSP